MYSNRDGNGIDAELADQGSWRAVTLAHSQVAPAPAPKVLQRAGSLVERYDAWRHEMSDRLERLDLTPDLASCIGSRKWFRGLATLIGLGALAIGFWPSNCSPPCHAVTVLPGCSTAPGSVRRMPAACWR